MDSVALKYRRKIGCWRAVAILAIIAFLAVLVGLVVHVAKSHVAKPEPIHSIPCPDHPDGGLLTSGDPADPSPFHDMTVAEYQRLYSFLRKEKKLNMADPERFEVNSSNIFMVDLLMPPKQDVLSFVDGQGSQPAREARVMMFRGDMQPPLVEEYRVGPLSNPTYAELIVNSQRRNPVPFALRPVSSSEYNAIYEHLLPIVDQKVGHILMESYGGKFTDCGDTCLVFYPNPVGTDLIQAMKRLLWVMADYPAEYYSLHPVGFGTLLELDGSDPGQWRTSLVWYAGAMYDSLDDLANKYATDPSINKTRMSYVHSSPQLKSTQALRGDPAPKTAQRPPLQMEPDGKRYTIHHRHVSYLHWDFDIRLSSFTGPQVYDVRYQGDRIAYELGVSEIAVYYSGFSPMQRVTNFVDSGALIGTHSKSLIPGVDCPEGATFLNVTFLGEGMTEATTLARAQCVFEQNTGVPLRRHLSYARGQGAFYGGMADSVLIVRSILTIVNYDYIIDFVFHQSGAIECRAISTGYILSTSYLPGEAPYGFRLDEYINGNIHHHMFHFKADLDVGGLSNRYETLDITEEEVQLRQRPSTTYGQIRFDRRRYATEDDAVYHYNFDTPRYHIVHNEQKKTKYGAPRAFRIHMAAMSKQMLPLGKNNERTIPWARQQLAVTVQKDDELVGSSPYAMFDSLNPVTDFSKYINGEDIVDKDLVFWVTMGVHHIPHTEDIPVTPTVGGHLAFYLLPYNYFPECPSVSSRDNVRVEYVTPNNPADGLKVERNGNKVNQACGAVSLEQLVKENPDHILQTHRDFRLF